MWYRCWGQPTAFASLGAHDGRAVEVLARRADRPPPAAIDDLPEAGRKIAASLTAGSSLKFCLLATGEADLCPRFGRTMEWDTAAGDAIPRRRGGRDRSHRRVAPVRKTRL